MKKRVPITIAMLICLALFMMGCGNGNGSEDSIRFDYDLSEYVELGQYKGIEIPARDMPDIDVSDDDILREIQFMLEMAAPMEEIFEGVIMVGDTANIDYAGSKDGILFPGGTAEGYDLEIGSGRFIPGFEEGLIGKTIGDTVVLELAFPDPYRPSPELSGADVEFVVTINSVRRFDTPELNDEFVQANSEYDTVEELKEFIREQLMEEADENFVSELEEFLLETIMDNATILGHPDKETKALFDERKKEAKEYADRMNMRWRDFLAHMEMTEAEFDELLMEEVKWEIGFEMVFIAIARQEGLELSEAEYEEGKLRLLEQIGFGSEQAFLDATGMSFEDTYTRRTLEMMILYEKVMQFVKDNIVIVD